MLALRIVEIIFPLFSIAALGAFYAWRFRPDMQVPNTLNMNIFVPALIFTALVDQPAALQDFQAILIGAAAVVLGSGVLGWMIAKLCAFEPRTFVPPMMFCNSGNMGLPLLTLTFGPAALPTATMLFLVENVLHFTLGSFILNRHKNPFRNLLSPIIVATILALTLNALHLPIDEKLLHPVAMLSKVSIPVMIFSLGTRLIDIDLHEWKIGLTAAISAPLCGLAIALAILPWLELTRLQAGALILFGALPPAVLNFMFAERYQQEPARVASIVITSHLSTLITLPLALAIVIPNYG